MHKLLLNRQNLERFSHQGFVNSLTSSFIYQKYGAQNFTQQKNRNFHAKFNAFLLRIFRPLNIKKNNYFPNLQFEFGLTLFFLKMVRKIPEKHRLEIQLQNNSVSFVQFVTRNNYIHNNTQSIQTIQKYQPSIFESENSVNYFYKSELNRVTPQVWKGQLAHKQQSVPAGIDNTLSNNIIRVTKNNAITTSSEKLIVNNLFRAIRIFSEEKRFQSIMFNKQQIDALEIHKQTKTIDTRALLTMALRFSHKFNELPVKRLQQNQVKNIKLPPQSFINGDNLPDLVHKKPAETAKEPKNETQIATVDQHTPFRMMRPQGIIESSTGNQLVDIDHLTDKVMNMLEQRLKTEQERRGIFI